LAFFIATTTTALAGWLALIAQVVIAAASATHAAFAALTVHWSVALAVQGVGGLLQPSGLLGTLD
jgi:hypothetical protein